MDFFEQSTLSNSPNFLTSLGSVCVRVCACVHFEADRPRLLSLTSFASKHVEDFVSSGVVRQDRVGQGGVERALATWGLFLAATAASSLKEVFLELLLTPILLLPPFIYYISFRRTLLCLKVVGAVNSRVGTCFYFGRACLRKSVES